MDNIPSDAEHRKIMMGYFHNIEVALEFVRNRMSSDASAKPDVNPTNMQAIEVRQDQAQTYRSHDPAGLAKAAREDIAVQKLLKRASSKTPIRAG